MIDYIIVGQGLAGTMLAYFLKKAGQRVHVLDNDYPRSSSKHAAGIINPVTGRRYVKSWRIEDLLPFAHATYRDMEATFGIKVLYPIPVIRTLYDQKDRNNWMLRMSDPAYEPYMDGQADLGTYEGRLHPDFSYGETLQTARLDVPAFLAHFRAYWQSREELTTAQLEIADVELLPGGVAYGELKAKQMIFCEGSWGKYNPYFKYLPFRGSKGEIMEVSIPGVPFDRIFKRKLFIVPLQNGNYWVGTANPKENLDQDLPSEEGLAELLEKLKAFLKSDFEIVRHSAAVRPTVKDRRPFVGIHPNHPQIGIFNGLGTKGASLGPYWAAHFVQHLLEKAPLDPAVDISRYAVADMD